MPELEYYQTLYPSPDDHALQEGFEACVHDPYWFLSRQWQMGEHQGEDASTPVSVKYQLRESKIEPSANSPDLDPIVIPGEAIVESELDDYWTIGRRIRLGQKLIDKVPQEKRHQFLFRQIAPPYDRFSGTPDGLLLWRNRKSIPIEESEFGPDGPPVQETTGWNEERLWYEKGFPTRESGLVVEEHHGGPLDWYSVHAIDYLPAADRVQQESVIPVHLEYPGSPANRFWEVEDAEVDIGGYPPDVAHFPTMLLVDLIFSHSDDWFLIPITAQAGHIVHLQHVMVVDSFGLEYSSQTHAHGLTAPGDSWSLFHCNGLEAGALVLWNVAETPLESGVMEQVQFGIDESANLLWAIERVIDGRSAELIDSKEQSSAKGQAVLPQSLGNMSVVSSWQYDPGDTPQKFWHPYIRMEKTGPDNRLKQRFVQHGLTDFSTDPPTPTPRPLAELLIARNSEAPEEHCIACSAVPPNGISVERRWMLARDLNGNPILWIQRQRAPLLSPPSRNLRFDTSTVVNADE